MGKAATEVSQEQVEAMVAAWRAYFASPVVTARSGEAGGSEEKDRMVINANGAQVPGDDVGLERLSGQVQARRRELYASIVGAVHAGMSESEAARRGGVNRMTVRRLMGKK